MAIEAQGHETERVIMLTDGVVAIAATLLVLDIQIPDNVSSVAQALVALLPKIGVYAISFLVVFSLWTVHRRLFRSIVRTDTVLLWMNGLFLLCVAFLPVPVGIWRSHNLDFAAVAFYAVSMAVTAAMLSAMWWYTRHRASLSATPLSTGLSRRMALLSIAFPGMFLVSIPIATFSIHAANAIWILVVVLVPVLTHRGASSGTG